MLKFCSGATPRLDLVNIINIENGRGLCSRPFCQIFSLKNDYCIMLCINSLCTHIQEELVSLLTLTPPYMLFGLKCYSLRLSNTTLHINTYVCTRNKLTAHSRLIHLLSLCVCLSVCLPVCLSVCLVIHHPHYPHIPSNQYIFSFV